jgi:hypothetical protein
MLFILVCFYVILLFSVLGHPIETIGLVQYLSYSCYPSVN